MKFVVFLVTIMFMLVQSDDPFQAECLEFGSSGYAASLADPAVLVGSGCREFTDGRTVSKSCCDTMDKIFQNPCVKALFEVWDTGKGEMYRSVAYNYLVDIARQCRVVSGIGYNETMHSKCGDGIVQEANGEYCDTGFEGSGCSGCFVDDGFDCFIPVNSSSSICWQCETLCSERNRHACTFPGGPCGGCLDGFKEDDTGWCGKVKNVYYAALNSEDLSKSSADCQFHPVAVVVESGPVPSAQRFVDAVRLWRPNRTELLQDPPCNARSAMLRPPTGESVLLVLEVLADSVIHHSSYVRNGLDVVIFADGAQKTVTGSNLQMVDVFFGSDFYYWNVHVTECEGHDGGLVTNYGRTIIEHAKITACSEETVHYLDYTCTGHLLLSIGALVMQDVEISSMHFQALPSSENCLVYDPSMVYIISEVHFNNVRFEDNYVEGEVLSVANTHGSSVLRDISFRRNVCTDFVFEADLNVVLEGLVVHSNIVSTPEIAVLSFLGRASVQDFSIVNNTVYGDAGILYNSGKLYLGFGEISFNGVRSGANGQESDLLGRGGAIVNRGFMSVENTTFQGNTLGALRSTGVVSLHNCTFLNNLASTHYSTVYATRALEIDECVFYQAEGVDTLAVVSDTPFIVRDSVLPGAASMPIVRCDETVLEGISGASRSPCGINAICTESHIDGVHCECPTGFFGSPLSLCSPLATIHVLPDTYVVSFVTKDYAGKESVERVGLISDGVGIVTWSIAEHTLPPWASVAPSTGTFSNDDVCLSPITNVQIILSTNGIVASSPHHNASVLISMAATRNGEDFFYSGIPLTLDVVVKVLPNATFSVAVPRDCNLGDALGKPPQTCPVMGGSEVSLLVQTYDAEGLPMGIGGTTFSVHVLPMSSYAGAGEDYLFYPHLVLPRLSDFNNGSYMVVFDAPQEHFFVAVEIDGDLFSGCPIFYSVYCADGWEFTDGVCTKTAPEVPVKVVASALAVMLLFCSGSFSYLYRNRRYFEEMFQMVMLEVMSVTLCGVGELFDILSDIGTLGAVLTTDELSSFVPYYTVAVPIAFVLSAIYLYVIVSDLRQALRKQRYAAENFVNSNTDALPGNPRTSTVLRSSVVAVGIGTFESLEELNEAISQLQRKVRRMYLELSLLIVEDVPLLVLGVLVMMQTDGTHLTVMISLQFTCLMIGATLTNVRGVKETKSQLERLRSRRDIAVWEIMHSSLPKRCKENVLVGDDAHLDGKLNKESSNNEGNLAKTNHVKQNNHAKQTVTSALLQTCVIT
eukprot:Rmarinus@m.11152